MTTTNRAEFAATRAIFINSLSPGCINEIRLQGNTCLTGANGNGKTSYLRCLPLFYGEVPQRIVPTSPNLKTFYEYYLPAPNSFIVFEYQRADGDLRCVFLYTDESGRRLHYRFARQGFDAALVIAEGQRVVSGRELERHWASLQVHGSVQLDSTADYRRVIQADMADAGLAARRLRPLLHDYACAAPGRPMANIHTIVQSMFKRQADFDDLRDLVIQSVSPDAQDAGIRLDIPVATLESWPGRMRAYQRAMEARDDVLIASQAHAEVQAQNARLATLRAQVSRLARHFAEEATKAHARKLAHAAQRVEEEERAKTASGVIKERLQAAEGETGKIAGEVNGIRERGKDLKEKNAPALAALAAKESALRPQKERLDKERDALVAGGQRIEEQYRALFEGPTQGKQRSNDDHQKAEADIARILGDQERAAMGQHEERVAGLDADFKRQRQALSQAYAEATTALGEARATARNPVPDEAVAAALEAKRDAESQAVDQFERAREAHRGAENTKRGAQASHERAETAYREATRKAGEARDARRAAEAAVQPAPNSLQGFLDTEVPGWEGDIGKVIEPGLLARTDLHPQVVGDAGPRSLYGVHLRVDGLPESVATDREARQAALVVATERLRDAEAAEEDAKQGIRQASKDVAATTQEESRLLAELSVAEAKRNNAKAEREQAQRLVKESREKASEEAQERLKEAQQAAAAAENALAKADKAHESARADLVGAREQQITAARAHAEERRKAESDANEARLAAFNAEIASLKSRRDTALREEGVDTDALSKVDEQLRQVRGEIDQIERSRQVVQAWLTWVAVEEPRLPELEAQLKAAQNRVAEAKKELDAHQAAWTDRESVLRRLENAEKDAHEGAERQSRECEDLAETIGKALPPGMPPAAEPAEVDSVWTHGYINTQAMSALTARREWQGKEDAYLAAVCKRFNEHAGSPPHQYLQQANSPDAGAMLKQLLAWFVDSESGEAAHKQHKTLLITEAAQIGHLSQQFHADLEKFHRDIHGFNRDLQAALDRNCRFEAISKLSFRVDSAVKALAFWPTIERLVVAFNAWQAEKPDELPGDAFGAALARLLEHAELRKGLEADRSKLIRLEGSIEDKGEERRFTTGQQLQEISSHGLSYLVLISLFLAFIHRIRGESPVNVAWSLDELLALDAQNVQRLLQLLKDNRVTLVCAFPDPNPETISLFANRYLIGEDKRPGEAHLADSAMALEIEALAAAVEADHV